MAKIIGELTVVAGERVGACFPIARGASYTIGRGDAVDIQLAELRGRLEAVVRCDRDSVFIEPGAGRVVFVDLSAIRSAIALTDGMCVRFDNSRTMLVYTLPSDGLAGALGFALAVTRAPTMRLNHAYGALKDRPVMITVDAFRARPRDREPPIRDRIADVVSHAVSLVSGSERIDALAPDEAACMRTAAVELSVLKLALDASDTSGHDVNAQEMRFHLGDAMRQLIQAGHSLGAAHDGAIRLTSELKEGLARVVKAGTGLGVASSVLNSQPTSMTLDDFHAETDAFGPSTAQLLSNASNEGQHLIEAGHVIFAGMPEVTARLQSAVEALAAVRPLLDAASGTGMADIAQLREHIATATSAVATVARNIESLLADPVELAARVRRAGP